MDEEFAEVILEGANNERIEGAAADREQEANLRRAKFGSFKGVGDGSEDRAAERVLVLMRLQALVVQERLHDLGEAGAVERRGVELERRAVGQADDLHSRVVLDRIAEDGPEIGTVGLAMREQVAEARLQLFGRGQQLRLELFFADLIFPIAWIDMVLAGQFGDEHLMDDGAIDVGTP